MPGTGKESNKFNDNKLMIFFWRTTPILNWIISISSKTLNISELLSFSTHTFAKKVLQELISLGIFVRMPFVTPQDRCIRVSVGEDADLDKFEKALPVALERASK